MTAGHGERGMALVVVLIFTTAMAAAAVAFLAGRQSDALSLRGQLQAIEAQAMLDAALQQTAAVLVNRTERQMIPPVLRWQFGNVAVAVRLESEFGKVDLNKADELDAARASAGARFQGGAGHGPYRRDHGLA